MKSEHGPNVATTVGDVPEDELQVSITKQDNGESWTVIRECIYRGTAHPEVYGAVIRRDVWVTMKQGLKGQVESSL